MNYKSIKISEDARTAKQSVITGDVTIGRDSCVLHFAVIRGDEAPVVIGEESNIQENCTVHVSVTCRFVSEIMLQWDIMQ